MSGRGEQHPFTPEPRVPEPWPERDITPWEWAEGEPGESGIAHSMMILDDEELERMAKWERKQRRKYRRRGFSIGF